MSNNPGYNDRLEYDSGLAPCIDLAFKGIRIRVASDCAIPANHFDALRDYATGMEVARPAEDELPDAQLVYRSTDEMRVDYSEDERTMRLQGPATLFGRGTALTYTAQYMAECLRAAKTGVLLVHAAAVKAPNQDRSCVILGEKGAGKTSLALRLCHQYGYELIGNDQVFLGPDSGGALITDGGNAWFNVRQTAIRSDAYLSQLLPTAAATDRPSWESKMKIHPATLGIASHQRPAIVGPIVHIRIDPTQPTLHARKWEGVQRNLLLHERFGRHISGQATPLQDDDGNYLGSLPQVEPQRAFQARDALVRLVTQTGIVEVFAPDVATAAQFIHGDGQ